MRKFTVEYTADIIFTGKKQVPYNINGKDDNGQANLLVGDDPRAIIRLE